MSLYEGLSRPRDLTNFSACKQTVIKVIPLYSIQSGNDMRHTIWALYMVFTALLTGAIVTGILLPKFAHITLTGTTTPTAACSVWGGTQGKVTEGGVFDQHICLDNGTCKYISLWIGVWACVTAGLEALAAAWCFYLFMRDERDFTRQVKYQRIIQVVAAVCGGMFAVTTYAWMRHAAKYPTFGWKCLDISFYLIAAPIGCIYLITTLSILSICCDESLPYETKLLDEESGAVKRTHKKSAHSSTSNTKKGQHRRS